MRRGYLTPPVLLGLTIICLVVAATLYYNSLLIKTAKNQTISNPSPSAIPSSGSTGSSKETTNWKTYTNTEWNYQIIYPRSWDFEEYEYNKNWVWLTSSYGRIDIGVRPKTESTLEKEARVRGQSHQPMCMEDSPCEGLPAKSVQKKSDPRFKELYEVINADDIRIVLFPLPRDMNYYIEIRTVAEDRSKSVVEEVSNQILSTFKFLK